MAKKLILLAMAIAALAAFAVPAAASASKIVMAGAGESGEPVAPPSGSEAFQVTGTSNVGQIANPLVTETEVFGILACEEIMLGGQLEKNDGSTVEGKGVPAESSTGGCTIGEEFNANVFEISLDEIKSVNSGEGTFEASFTAEILSEVDCHFATTSPGNFTYTPGGNIITVEPTPLSGGACGMASIEGEVELDIHWLEPTTETTAIELW